MLEVGGLPSRGIFFAQSRQGLLEESQGPTLVEDFFGCEFAQWFELVLGFGRSLVPGKMGVGAAAFEGVRAFPFVSEKMFERGEQKGAELAALAIGQLKRFFLQEPREECLS